MIPELRQSIIELYLFFSAVWGSHGHWSPTFIFNLVPCVQRFIQHIFFYAWNINKTAFLLAIRSGCGVIYYTVRQQFTFLVTKTCSANKTQAGRAARNCKNNETELCVWDPPNYMDWAEEGEKRGEKKVEMHHSSYDVGVLLKHRSVAT